MNYTSWCWVCILDQKAFWILLTRDPASDRILRVSAPQLRKRGSRRSPVFSYDTYALIEEVTQDKKKLAVSTAIISHRHHPGPFTLSSSEVFCLIALAIRSKNANPNDAVFAADTKSNWFWVAFSVLCRIWYYVRSSKLYLDSLPSSLAFFLPNIQWDRHLSLSLTNPPRLSSHSGYETEDMNIY